MRDNLRRSRAIRDALTQGYPGEPPGNRARPVTTLAALMSGMVASKSTQRPKSATQVPDGHKPERRVKRLARWRPNDRLSEARYVLPSADLFVTPWAWRTLGLVIEGRGVGRRGIALMLHVVYKGRAAPGLARASRHKGPLGRRPP
jgi:hypothetical protein